MKNISFLIFLITITNFVNSQNIEWSMCYGGTEDDQINEIIQIEDNHFIAVGYTSSDNGDVSENNGYVDYWIIKLNEYGSIIWEKTYGGSYYDWVNSVQQTTDGGFIVVGTTRSIDGDVNGNHGYNDYWILKLDEYGDTLWTRCYGGSLNDQVSAVQQTTDGGYILTGSTRSIDGDVNGNNGLDDFWILKLDEFGEILWSKTYGGSNNDYGKSVEQTADGKYMVLGTTTSNDGDVSSPLGETDYWILKLDEFGDILWARCYGGTNDDYASSIQQVLDGGYVVLGYSKSDNCHLNENNGETDYWILKLNELGNTQWSKSYGGSDTESAFSMHQTTDDGFIVAGYTKSNDLDVNGNHGYWDSWILELDMFGDTIWTRCYGGLELDKSIAVIQSNDGGFVIAGETKSNDGDIEGNHGNSDCFVLKLNNNNTGILNQKLSDVVQVFPNPTTGIINIKTEKITKIEVYNLLGELILESNSEKIDIGDHSSGIYYIKIFNDKEIATKKIIKN